MHTTNVQIDANVSDPNLSTLLFICFDMGNHVLHIFLGYGATQHAHTIVKNCKTRHLSCGVRSVNQEGTPDLN